MQTHEEKYIYDWEHGRGKGKWSYRLLTTIIWGTLLPLAYTLIKLLLRLDFWPSTIFSEIFQKDFLYLWLRSLAGVFLFTSFMWYLSSKKYKELKQKQLRQKSFQEMDSTS